MAASADALVHFVPAASGAAASASARTSIEAAIGAARTMEEAMRLLTINELWRLTKIELCDLAAEVANDVLKFLPGTRELDAAFTSLRNISYVLGRRDFSPWRSAAVALHLLGSQFGSLGP